MKVHQLPVGQGTSWAKGRCRAFEKCRKEEGHLNVRLIHCRYYLFVLVDELQSSHRKRKSRYRKIPKMSPGAYVFRRTFLRGLFLEGACIRRGLFLEGACIRRGLLWEVFLRFRFRGLLYGAAYFRNFTVWYLNKELKWHVVNSSELECNWKLESTGAAAG